MASGDYVRRCLVLRRLRSLAWVSVMTSRADLEALIASFERVRAECEKTRNYIGANSCNASIAALRARLTEMKEDDRG